MVRTKYVSESELSVGLRAAFNIAWQGVKPSTNGMSSIYESIQHTSKARAHFEKNIPAQEAWCWEQRDRECREVTEAYDQVWREDAEFVEAWDAHQPS